MRSVPIASALLLLTALLVSAPAGASRQSGDGTEPTRDELASIRKALDEEEAVLAISLIEALHDQGQASAESFYLLGMAYQLRVDQVGLLSKRKVSKQLRQALERALELDPAHLGAHEELADFYFFAPGIVGGSKKKADAQIEILEGVSPSYASRVRGRHAYNSGDYRRAETEFTRSLETDPSQAQVFYLRGLARRQLLEKDAAALQDFDRALALGYEEPMLYYQVGRLCVRLETCAARGEESLKTFITRSEGRNRAFGHYRLAQLYEQNDRLPEALTEAEASIELEPELDDARALLERVEGKLSDGA